MTIANKNLEPGIELHIDGRKTNSEKWMGWFNDDWGESQELVGDNSAKKKVGAGDGNRTHVSDLEDLDSSIKLHPHSYPFSLSKRPGAID